MMNKQKTGFGAGYKKSLKYIYSVGDYIILIAMFFLASAILGYAFSDKLGFLDKIIKQIAEDTEGLGWGAMILFIFRNNLMSSLWAMLSGILFGIIPIFTSVFNGVLLGYVYSRASVIEGYGVIWRLLPHGIFELPAVFISLALGIKLGTFWFAKHKKRSLIKYLKDCFLVFLAIVIPLLLIAAIIEGTLITFVG